VSKEEIAAFSVHAGVAQERWTTMISQMIETLSSITLESATESGAGVVGQRLVRKCADPYFNRTVLEWNTFILGTQSIIIFRAKKYQIIILIHTPTRTSDPNSNA